MKPKYWCKHCKTFVRDTKLEKQNHEATPKHQGNLQRFLRDLHRGHEREERDAQRAKAEVARLNGLTTGSATAGVAPPGMTTAIPAIADGKRGGRDDRKRQLQQLADMGIAVPEEARREMAMAGDWQTQSVTPFYSKIENLKKEDDDEDQKPSGSAVGIRKRKHEGDDEKEEAGAAVVKKGWGASTRTWQFDNDGDLDTLLASTKIMKRKPNDPLEASPPTNLTPETTHGDLPPINDDNIIEAQHIKTQDPGDVRISGIENAGPPCPTDARVESEEGAGDVEIVFKKRKAKSNRQNI